MRNVFISGWGRPSGLLVVAALVLAAIGPARATALADGTVGGTVCDVQGQGLPGATVTLRRPAIGFERSVSAGPEARR